MVSANSRSASQNTYILERSLPTKGSHHNSFDSSPSILESPQKLVVVDPSIEDHRGRMKQTDPTAKKFLLDPNSDGVEQITQILYRYSEIISLHVISSGTSEQFCLGGTRLSLSNLDCYAWDLQDWCSSFSATGSGKIILYGCTVVAGGYGFEFVHRFSQLTGVDVIASSTWE
jgi:hypothetical protein